MDRRSACWQAVQLVIAPGPGEPPAGPWRVASFGEFVGLVLGPDAAPGRRPRVIAIDGRSGSGKSTLAARLQNVMPASAIVRTDDVAWHHSAFGWAELLVEGVLELVRAGRAVHYRPPAWDARARPGAIEVPDGLDVVIVEGVGAGRRELAALVDTIVWVQSDFAESERRGIARDIALGVNGDRDAAIAFWHAWMAEELPFLARQRPWERATIIVAGTPRLVHDDREIVIAPPTSATVRR